jgi:hypothetical protein
VVEVLILRIGIVLGVVTSVSDYSSLVAGMGEKPEPRPLRTPLPSK